MINLKNVLVESMRGNTQKKKKEFEFDSELSAHQHNKKKKESINSMVQKYAHNVLAVSLSRTALHAHRDKRCQFSRENE